VGWGGEKPSPSWFLQINNHFVFNGPLLNMLSESITVKVLLSGMQQSITIIVTTGEVIGIDA